jgi:hypothetical protein
MDRGLKMGVSPPAQRVLRKFLNGLIFSEVNSISEQAKGPDHEHCNNKSLDIFEYSEYREIFCLW